MKHSDSPVIHVYSFKRSRRLKYVLRELFDRRVGCGFVLHHDMHAFEHAEGPKIFYGAKKTEGFFRIRPNRLLFEKRLSPQEVEHTEADGLTLLFPEKHGDAGHDVFAACFYLLSRYEEYQPHRSDEHGRFVSTSSIGFRLGFTEVAMVERYLMRLLELLEKHNNIRIPWRTEARLNLTVDVDQLWQYKAKGMARSVFGMAKDAWTNRRSLGQRLAVMSGQESEPLDIYDELIDRANGNLTFFIQVGNTSRFDHNNPIHFSSVQQRINELAAKARIGIHPSYFAGDDPERMTMECERFRQVCNASLFMSRQHYLRFNLPATFRLLIDSGITKDYSMMFPDAPGFRASTSHPFMFFDLEQDRAMPLEIFPAPFMDLQLSRSHKPEKALEKIRSLMKEVIETHGHFIPVFHPECLIGIAGTYATMPMYEQVIKLWKDGLAAAE